MKQRMSVALLVAVLGLLGSLSALADVPEFGTVTEGLGVPGVTLESTRAQVEEVYGEPTSCQSLQAVFEVNKARKGTYTLTIDDVIVEDHPFDIENSVLSASIFKRR